MIDPNDPKGAHALERLGRERTAWMTSVTPDGQPQTMPVWFLWDDGSILVYSFRTAVRNRNVAANPKVSFVLNTDDEGEDLVIVEGEARLVPDDVAARDNPPFLEKYRSLIDQYGWTPEKYSTDYPHPIRIRPTRVRFG
ncbi:MAG TPA: TIGR03667 family PPOX class F420-dependent oxidoreductase [Candidatus Limnocylindrales bacterium]|nr:TIGR03667 family PPOX class F420-dependent oxidoreductase [Candidatus Limnocylindrales bacterium]